MPLTELTIRLLILFFPGLIAVLFYDFLLKKKERNYNMFLTFSFVIGLASYLLLYLIIMLINFLPYANFEAVNIIDVLLNPKSMVSILQIISVSIIAIILVIIFVYSKDREWLRKLFTKTKLSNLFYRDDVWSEVFNQEDTVWVRIRDYNNKLIYDGWVEFYSDGLSKNELYLRDVIVYDLDSVDEKYQVPAIYLSLLENVATIEFPNVANKKE